MPKKYREFSLEWQRRARAKYCNAKNDFQVRDGAEIIVIITDAAATSNSGTTVA